jgi:tRNA(Ile)-lysidine synthase
VLAGVTTFLEQLAAGFGGCGCAGARVLLAVSGGADSVALLRGVVELGSRIDVEPVVAHLNHRLRGSAAEEDAAWLSGLCERLGVPIVIGETDVRGAAETSRRGIEETARELRYAFLTETAREQGCTRIAVAHTADDQAETILHHIVRGTGLAGLRGMARRRPLTGGLELVRPLLGIRRDAITGWLAEIGQDYRTDVTNEDERFTRNRLRHVLLPVLRRDFNERVDEALLRLGRQAAEAQDALESCARRVLDDAVLERTEARCRLQCEPLEGVPRHLVRTCFVILWRELGWPLQGMGFDEWELLARLVESGGAMSLPGGVEARRREGLLSLERTPIV